MGEIWRTFFVYLDYSTGKAVLADPESNNVLHDIHYFIISILISIYLYCMLALYPPQNLNLGSGDQGFGDQGFGVRYSIVV